MPNPYRMIHCKKDCHAVIPYDSLLDFDTMKSFYYGIYVFRGSLRVTSKKSM